MSSYDCTRATYLEEKNIGTMPCCKYPAAMRAVTCLWVGILVGVLPWNVRESVNTFEKDGQIISSLAGLIPYH